MRAEATLADKRNNQNVCGPDGRCNYAANIVLGFNLVVLNKKRKK